MENNTLTLRFSIIEPLVGDILIADLEPLLLGKADAVTGPSPTGGARQSHEPGSGGTLKKLRKNYGYEVVLTEGVTSLTIPGVRVLNGVPVLATSETGYAAEDYFSEDYNAH